MDLFCFACGFPLAEYGCNLVLADGNTYATCRAPLYKRRPAEELLPTEVVCGRTADLGKEDVSLDAVIVQCERCGQDVWLNPSSREVERRLGRELARVCSQCWDAKVKPGDMGITTVSAEREAAEVMRRRRQRVLIEAAATAGGHDRPPEAQPSRGRRPPASKR